MSSAAAPPKTRGPPWIVRVFIAGLIVAFGSYLGLVVAGIVGAAVGGVVAGFAWMWLLSQP